VGLPATDEMSGFGDWGLEGREREGVRVKILYPRCVSLFFFYFFLIDVDELFRWLVLYGWESCFECW